MSQRPTSTALRRKASNYFLQVTLCKKSPRIVLSWVFVRRLLPPLPALVRSGVKVHAQVCYVELLANLYFFSRLLLIVEGGKIWRPPYSRHNLAYLVENVVPQNHRNHEKTHSDHSQNDSASFARIIISRTDHSLVVLSGFVTTLDRWLSVFKDGHVMGLRLVDTTSNTTSR